MKKSTIIILSITLPLILIIISVLSFLFYKNLKYDNKEILTVENFKNIMNKYSDSMEVITEKYETSMNLDEGIYFLKENQYEVAYLIFKDDESSKKYFENEKKYIKNNMDEFYKYNYIGLNSYGRFTVTSKNKYIKILRLKNSIVCIFSNKESKKEVDNLIKELNY